MVRLSPLLLAALLVGGCGDNLEPGDDEPGSVLVTDGGRFPIVDCGRDVVTRSGAEAPQPGGDTFGPDPAPFQVHLGVGGDPARSVAVVWRTDVRTTAGRLELGAGDVLDRPVDGLTYRYRAGGELIRIHEVHLCGLTPDTEYTYRVGGGDAWSTPHRFRTAPDVAASPDASVRIAMTGDSRNGYPMWGDVAAEIAAQAPDLIVFSGDAVTTGTAQAQWDDFFVAGGELLATVPLVSTNGNHEANAVNFYSQLAMPGDEENFAIDLGHARITVLNDTPAEASDLGGAIRDFLDDQLGGSAGRWTIVSHHRPIWSSGTTHGSNAGLRDAWGPTLDAHHADLVVAGHDHIYERTLPIRGDQVQDRPADGTVYLVNGGAGAPLYGVDAQPFSAHAASRHGWVLVDVRRERLLIEAYEPGGAVPFDQLTITRP